MILVTVDSKRRILLPKELNIKPGQTLGVRAAGARFEVFPVEVIPSDEFQKLLIEKSSEYAESFQRLAKGEQAEMES